ncbi:MAG TPA: adenylate/guanylate cyclase domain-containing response regulator [Pyrinomonadaceae bacterium]|jgi:class 3 adenylate cyclase|nr:adenylate/guanylate cyclase domain-containing response regulator [Pyrinomonadaceae bacterium]
MRPQILIVDNEIENRENLQLALQDENLEWNITIASSDWEALEIIKARLKTDEAIDVLLTDLVMETEQSGMELLKEAVRLDPLIMAILFTAKEKSLDRYEAFNYGAFDVVEKNILGAAAHREINVKTRAALRYREWSQSVNFLRRYFDSKLFDRIMKDRSILAVKVRTLTICFWDVRGFSSLCEILKAHPDKIAEFLRDYFEIAAATIFEHDGILDKFIGDGVMALFGVLNDQEGNESEDAMNAIAAAKDLRDRFDKLLVKWKQQWDFYTQQKIDIGLGCGIATGEVLVGNVGTNFRDQFTALGADVNIASRIEARAKSGQILVSKATQARVKSIISLYPAGEINDIKNIPGTYELFSTEPPRSS